MIRCYVNERITFVLSISFFTQKENKLKFKSMKDRHHKDCREENFSRRVILCSFGKKKLWNLTNYCQIDWMTNRRSCGDLALVNSRILALGILYPQGPFFGVW